MRIVVTHPQVPFAHGGAEVLAEQLTEELTARGHEAALVTVPFKWYPRERILTHALAWRLLDLEEVEGRKIDLMIATKFPSYVARHSNKRVWLVHQLRQAYELDRTALGEFGEIADRPRDAKADPRARPSDARRGRKGCSRSRGTSPTGCSDRSGSTRRSSFHRRSCSTTAVTGTRTSSCPSAGSTARSASTSCSRPRRPSRPFGSSSRGRGPTASASSTSRAASS